MDKSSTHILITYEDETEILKKTPEMIMELSELSLGKKSLLDTDESKYGEIKMIKLFDEDGKLIEKKEH